MTPQTHTPAGRRERRTGRGRWLRRKPDQDGDPSATPSASPDEVEPSEHEGTSLEELMSRYAAGDDEAFAEIHRRTRPRLVAFLMMMAGDRSQAEDLCQITYLKLHRTRARYIDGAPLMPYLTAIARNAFLDSARKRKRAPVRVTSSGELPDRPDPATLRAPSGDLRQAIDRAVDQLLPLQREAFVLTKHRGLSPREAARQLGASEIAVKLRVHRAYLALRAALGEFREAV